MANILLSVDDPSPAIWNEDAQVFMQALVPPAVLEQVPVVGVVNGNTDYLDQFSPDDFGEGPFIKGVDRFRRAFLSMRVHVRHPDEEEKKCFEPKALIVTLFQRYSPEEPGLWKNKTVVCRSHRSPAGIRAMDMFACGLQTHVVVTQDNVQNLRALLSAAQGEWREYKEGVCIKLL